MNKTGNEKTVCPFFRRETTKGKIGIIIFMWTMVCISSFIIIKIIPLRILILSLGLIGAIVVWFIVPTAKDDI